MGSFKTARLFGNQRALVAAALHDPDRGVYIIDTDDAVAAKAHNYQDLLTDTQFSLIIRGDRPYSRRFCDVVCSGVVPVMLHSDGWVTPFTTLVPFTSYGVFFRFDELPDILDRLHNLPVRNVTRLRRNAKAFCARYIDSVAHQTDGLVDAVLL